MNKPRLVSVKTIERLFKYAYVTNVHLKTTDDIITLWICFDVEFSYMKISHYILPAYQEDRTENIERLYQVLKAKWEERKHD